MDINNDYMSEEMNITDTDMDLDAGAKKNFSRVDRRSAKYSADDFMNLPRSEQLALAEKYWNGSVSTFDDGTFQFSYSHLGTLCRKLGFRKGIVDTMPEHGDSDSSSIIYIEHGRREEPEVKKFTFDKSTIAKIDELLGKKLSNVERSKVIDAILSQALDQRLNDKRAGTFGVHYRPIAEERLL